MPATRKVTRAGVKAELRYAERMMEWAQRTEPSVTVAMDMPRRHGRTRVTTSCARRSMLIHSGASPSVDKNLEEDAHVPGEEAPRERRLVARIDARVARRRVEEVGPVGGSLW